MTTPCVRLAALLAEAIQQDRTITALCQAEYGRPLTTLVGADRRKLLADKVSPLCLIIPPGTSPNEGGVEHKVEVVLAVVDDKTAPHAAVPVLNGLVILDERLRPKILHLAQNLPVHVSLHEWRSDINIEEFPLIIEHLELVLSENIPIGNRFY